MLRQSFVFGIYGLITVLVFQFMGDIRRQRHLAQLIQDLLKDSLIVELDQSVSFVYYINDLTLQDSVSESDLCSRTSLFTRLDQTLPDIIFPSLQEKDLNCALAVKGCFLNGKAWPYPPAVSGSSCCVETKFPRE